MPRLDMQIVIGNIVRALCLVISVMMLIGCQSEAKTGEPDTLAPTLTETTSSPTANWLTGTAEMRETAAEAVNNTQTASAATYVAEHPTAAPTQEPFSIEAQVNDTVIYRWGENICIARHANDPVPAFLAK